MHVFEERFGIQVLFIRVFRELEGQSDEFTTPRNAWPVHQGVLGW